MCSRRVSLRVTSGIQSNLYILPLSSCESCPSCSFACLPASFSSFSYSFFSHLLLLFLLLVQHRGILVHLLCLLLLRGVFFIFLYERPGFTVMRLRDSRGISCAYWSPYPPSRLMCVDLLWVCKRMGEECQANERDLVSSSSWRTPRGDPEQHHRSTILCLCCTALAVEWRP